MPRIVRDALLCDSRILDVYDFSFAFETENVTVNFTADTIFGKTNISEVI
jgi:hypothetical protein